MNSENRWLRNVRLECGYAYDDEGVIASTVSELYHIRIENGAIAELVAVNTESADSVPVGEHTYDAAGALLLPPFQEMHIHIDKTYYSDRWRAVKPAKSIFDRFKEEERLLPELLPKAQERAENMLATLLAAGTTHVRTHCNIDQVVKLNNLEAILRAFETFAGKITYEIVAFPQHGLLRSDAAGLVREALQHGAALVGGVDPQTVDGDIETSLQTMMELAVEANANIDLHLHEGGATGLATIRRLAELAEEAGWQGRVTLSHAFALGQITGTEADEMAARLASLGISIATTVPFHSAPPVPMLRQHGVHVMLGTDSINDHWSPFGNGDQLEKAGRLAERFGWVDERSLGQALRHITGGVTALSETGNRLWPNVGDDASGVLVEASCSAEAVARRAKRKAVVVRGSVV